MVLKVLGFIGLNFLLSLLIVGILFIGLFIRMAITTKSSRIILNIILIFLDTFVIFMWHKWFGIWALLMPILMFIFSIFCFLLYKDDNEYADDNENADDN